MTSRYRGLHKYSTCWIELFLRTKRETHVVNVDGVLAHTSIADRLPVWSIVRTTCKMAYDFRRMNARITIAHDFELGKGILTFIKRASQLDEHFFRKARSIGCSSFRANIRESKFFWRKLEKERNIIYVLLWFFSFIYCFILYEIGFIWRHSI